MCGPTWRVHMIKLNPKLSTLNRSSYVWTNLACAYDKTKP